MVSLNDRLVAAESRSTPQVDLDVVLDSGVADRIADIEEKLAGLTLDGRLADARPIELHKQLDEARAEAADTLLTLRFTKLDGLAWAALTLKNVMRPDVPVDLMYGYNFHAVCQAAAQLTGTEVDGETTSAISDKQWERLWNVLPGRDVQRICDAVWGLNEYGPEQRVEAAKKASEARSANASTSPST